MSRVGKAPVDVPSGVDVKIAPGLVTCKGPKGTLEVKVPAVVGIAREDDQLVFTRSSEERTHRAFHGLARALVANAVKGVSDGFEKALEIHGVGYRAALQGSDLQLQVGYSHPVLMSPPAGISFEVPAPNRIVVKGIDKEQVGQVAANVRSVRKPEPYKGKGIRYEGEHIVRKAGKTGK